MTRRLIVLEGISGAGKTTQQRMIVDRLARTACVEAIGEFSNWATGSMAGAAYGEGEGRFVRLHPDRRFADYTHLVLLADVVAKAAAAENSSGDLVVIDRFCDSWRCYTLASPERIWLTDEIVINLHERFAHELFRGLAEVRTVYLRISVEEAERRLALRDGRADSEGERGRLARIGELLDRLYESSAAVQIDGAQSPAQVTEAIINALGLGSSVPGRHLP